MSYAINAGEIVDQATKLGADRVCFYDGGYAYAEPTVEAVGDALTKAPDGRYKIQSIRDGKWTDLNKYAPVFNSTQLLSDLSLTDFTKPVVFEDKEVSRAVKSQPARFHNALRRLFYDTVDQQLKKPDARKLAAICDYFGRFDALWKDDEHFNYFLAYLQLLQEAFASELVSAVAGRKVAPHNSLMELLLARNNEEVGQTTTGATAAARCVLGQIGSLNNRDAAATHFAALRESEQAELIKFFYYDLGALTYYSADELDMEALGGAAGTIAASIQPVDVSAPTNTLGVGVSMDTAFFRIYAAWLYFYAQQLPEIDFNFFLCADEAEAADLMNDGDQFMSALANLNRGGKPSNINIYRIPTPGYVKDEKTFYACARFFTISELLSRYPNAYLMDADLYLEANPTTFFRQVRNVAFAVPETTTTGALSPWRRHMAGNVAISRDVLGTGLVRDLQAYITHGLRQSGSWMLDQNALTFAIENNPEDGPQALNKFKRPFVAPKFMGTWESNYKRANA